MSLILSCLMTVTMKSSLNTSEYSCQKLSSELRQVKTELDKEQTLRTEADTCNKKWTTVVTDSKDQIAGALAAMSALLDSGSVVAVEKTEQVDKSNDVDKKDIKKEK